MRLALAQAENCSDIEFYGVGCVIVSRDGEVLATGFTGELAHAHNGQLKKRHAEEVAIIRVEALGTSLVGATLYSTLEPCSERSSGLLSCTQRILGSGIERVVFGAYEPYDERLKITCQGEKLLQICNDACLESIISKRKGE
jgi:5-amino-6-(5-phosphoribosylamino)uracil reductase